MENSRKQCAAQYLRMSTEVQDLSLAVQEAAVAAYCETKELTLVATYKDEARSGLELRGRPALQQLLRDVATPACSFSVILAYDVSRWGRFQQTDESAYWDFHCTLHGVRVVYVNEPFTQELESPMAAVIKNLKRAMAAEYSRELAIKVRAGQDRAIDLGFHMGGQPAIGLRRLAVSKEPGRTRLLQAGERKANPAEHIKWVLGPDNEVALVKRIFHLYAHTSLHMPGIVEILNSEGLRTATGATFTEPMLRAILDSEAFIGNFVWTRRNGQGARKTTDTDPLFRRSVGTIEPIIDRDTWDRVQMKRLWKKGPSRTKPQRLAHLRAALLESPAATYRELEAKGCGSSAALAEMFGSMREAVRLAGRDPDAVRQRKYVMHLRGWGVTKAIVRDLEHLLTVNGIAWGRIKRQHLLTLGGTISLRLQLMWKRPRHDRLEWFLAKHFWSGPYDYLLIARMNDDETAQDFLLMSRAVYRAAPPWAWVHLPQAVTVIRNAEEMVVALRRLLVQAEHSTPAPDPELPTTP